MFDFQDMFLSSKNQTDPSRKSIKLHNLIESLQETFNVIEECNKPVISCIHGLCIGGGIDLITACDIR